MIKSKAKTKLPNPIDDYINNFDENVQEILRRVRSIARKYAPNAIEKISYQIPSFHENGVIIYYAAFKNHFSIFPPIKGDEDLLEKTKPYANSKGNLLFKYKDETPWELIAAVIKQRILENQKK